MIKIDPNILLEAEALAESFPKAASELKDIEAWKHHEIELNSIGLYNVIEVVLELILSIIYLNTIGRTLALPELLYDNGEPVEVEAVDVSNNAIHFILT